MILLMKSQDPSLAGHTHCTSARDDSATSTDIFEIRMRQTTGYCRPGDISSRRGGQLQSITCRIDSVYYHQNQPGDSDDSDGIPP